MSPLIFGPVWSSLAVSICALQLAGCGASLSDMAGPSEIVSYKPANIVSPTGYSIEQSNDGIRVTAAGGPATPASRLEKIALARAAEYGAEQHKKTFKATPPQVGFTCGKTQFSDKGQIKAIKPLDLRTVQIDVSYAPDANDPAARNSKQTAETLKAELAAETVPADVQAANTSELAMNCHR